MIYLEKNTANDIILELTLNSSLASPYYLFEFTQDFAPKTVTYFSCEDQSSYKSRYNLFTITLSGSGQVLSAGTLDLRTGSYTVNVYEATAHTLSVSATTGTIIPTAKGIKAYVAGTDTQISSIYR